MVTKHAGIQGFVIPETLFLYHFGGIKRNLNHQWASCTIILLCLVLGFILIYLLTWLIGCSVDSSENDLTSNSSLYLCSSLK